YAFQSLTFPFLKYKRRAERICANEYLQKLVEDGNPLGLKVMAMRRAKYRAAGLLRQAEARKRQEEARKRGVIRARFRKPLSRAAECARMGSEDVLSTNLRLNPSLASISRPLTLYRFVVARKSTTKARSAR
ncbi:unnamed protein product, partial [Polarella glacialis]